MPTTQLNTTTNATTTLATTVSASAESTPNGSASTLSTITTRAATFSVIPTTPTTATTSTAIAVGDTHNLSLADTLVCNASFTGTTFSQDSVVGGETAPDAWSLFFAPHDGSYTFSTCSSSFSTRVLVYHFAGNISLLGSVAANYSETVGDYVASCDDCGPCGDRAALAVNLTIGAYWIVVDGDGTGQEGAYNLAVSCPVDSVIVRGSAECGGNYTGDTSEGVDGILDVSPEEVWIVTVVDNRTEYVFDTCGSDFDTIVHVLNTSAEENYNIETSVEYSTCDDCGPCGLSAVVTIVLDPGTYFVVVEGFDDEEIGHYSLGVRCSAPRPLPEPTLGGDLACDADVTGDTTDANNTLGDAAPDVWFAFTAPDSGSYTFRTCGSNFDTTIAVYDRTVLSGTVPSASNARATLGPMVTECDDCGECDENEILHAILLPGTYWIVVDGFNSESGRFRLQVVCSTSSAPTVAPTTTPSSSAPMPSDTTTPSSGASGMGSGGNDDGDAGLTWLWVVLPMMVFMGVIVGAMWYRQNALANPHQPSGASAEGHARGPGRSHAAENPVFRFNDDSVA
eukprot:m.115179 g.115179  ORF g.115179 m.115179 type:complete len:567 (+) comp17137_c0_seq10:1-1701(+)